MSLLGPLLSTPRGCGLGEICPLIVARVLGLVPGRRLGINTLIVTWTPAFPRLRPAQTRWFADWRSLYCLRYQLDYTMPLSNRIRQASLTLANLLLPIAVLVFATGFFPYKPVLPGLASWENDGGEQEESGAEAHAPFDKVVFMVVDALRSDFVFGEESAMGYVQGYVCLARHGEWILTWEQLDQRWLCYPLYRPRNSSNSHDASCQGSHHRLCTILPRSHPQLRRKRHLFLPRYTRYLACPAPSPRRGSGR